MVQADAVATTTPLSGTDGVRNTGTYISSAFGTRVAKPFFWVGFNTCVGAHAAATCANS